MLTTVSLSDRAEMGTRKRLANGFLLVDAVFARSGIQKYSAGEMGRKDMAANAMLKIWRPAAEVFKPASMATFESVPMTDNHPDDMVTDANAKELTVGLSGDRVYRDGNLMKGKLLVTHPDTIAKLDANKKVEISNGYQSQIDWTPGVVPAGEEDAGESYDGVQTDIEGNHIALVDAGRCGAACRVLDNGIPKTTAIVASDCSCEGEAAMADKALTKKIVDGIGMVEATDEAFSVIDKLMADNKKATDALAAKDGEIAALTATHATALAAKDKEIADAKAATPDVAAMDARVAARTKLVADAKLLDDKIVTDGKTDLDIQKDAVTTALGAEAVKDKSDAFFASAFDTLAITANKDAGDTTSRETPAQKDGLRDAFSQTRQPAKDKKPSYEDRMSARWKGGAKAQGAH